MPNMLRAVRRRVLAVLAAPLLLGTATAAAPASPSADQITAKETYYSSGSYTTIVGSAYRYCDGDLIMISGYETEYVRYKFIAACP